MSEDNDDSFPPTPSDPLAAPRTADSPGDRSRGGPGPGADDATVELSASEDGQTVSLPPGAGAIDETVDLTSENRAESPSGPSGSGSGAESMLFQLGGSGALGPALRLRRLGGEGGRPSRGGGRRRYERLRLLGRGGMGEVHLVADRDLKREVAMKEMRSSTPEALSRFVEEAQVLGQLEHPNIVPLYDLALSPRGLPYCTMRYLRGRSLAAVLDGLARGDEDLQSFTLTRLVQIFQQVVQAVGYAHDRGVVHRDLKPDNVMLGEHGEVQVIDWGLAKVLDRALAPKTARPKSDDRGVVMGTPAYMAPEQARGAEVDERADIYALGAMLYELLTLQRPHRGESAQAIVQSVLSSTPPPPRESAPEREVPTDLEHVCVKAMAKNPVDRYPSCAELDRDLAAFLEGRPISARPPSLGYVLRLALRRHRAVATTVFAALMLLTVGTATFLYRLDAARRTAEVQREAARTAQAVAQRQAREALASSVLNASFAQDSPRVARLLVLELASSDDLPKPPGLMQRALDLARQPVDAWDFPGATTEAAFSPDGRHVLTMSQSNRGYADIRIWRADGSGDPLLVRRDNGARDWDWLFSPDGSRLAWAEHTQPLSGPPLQMRTRVWDLESRTEAVLEREDETITGLAFDPEGRRIVTRDETGVVRVRGADGSELAELLRDPGGVRALAFTSDGRHVATGHENGTARLTPADGRGEPVVLAGHDAPVVGLESSPDGEFLVTIDESRRAISWGCKDGRRLRTLREDGEEVLEVSFSADGQFILTRAKAGPVRLWRTQGTDAPLRLPGHDGRTEVAAFSPSGRLVVTSGADLSVRIWTLQAPGAEPLAIPGLKTVAKDLRFLDGEERVVIADGGGARIWRRLNARDKKGRLWAEERVFELPAVQHEAQLSPDGRRLVTNDYGGLARIWAVDGSAQLPLLGVYDRRVMRFDLSPDGTRLVGASRDGTARVWSADGLNELAVLRGHDKSVSEARFSPDGTRVVTASADGTARVWRADGSGEPIVLEGHGERVGHVAFSPDGRRVVTTSWDGTARIWRSDGNGDPVVLRGHGGIVTSASFSPLGDRVLTGSIDGTARIWPGDGSGEPLVLAGHRNVFRSGFSPTGNAIFTLDNFTGLRLWSPDGTGEPRLLGASAGASFLHAGFSPDGELVALASTDGLARIWSTTDIGPPTLLEQRGARLRELSFSADGRRLLTVDSAARVWQLDGTGEPLSLQVGGDRVKSAIFSPSADRVFTLGVDGTVGNWPIEPALFYRLMRERTHGCLSVEQRRALLLETEDVAAERAADCLALHGPTAVARPD